jgi:hypothetical protein
LTKNVEAIVLQTVAGHDRQDQLSADKRVASIAHRQQYQNLQWVLRGYSRRDMAK